MIRFWNIFVKITGWPLWLFCFRTKIRYEDKTAQDRTIRGPAILISNHTSIFDYVVWLFAFATRTLRFQMAELLFKKPGLGLLIRLLGGIYVDRDSHSFDFIYKSDEILKKGGVVGIFPEARIPRPGERRPLDFKVSAAYLAMLSGVQVIPVYTDGHYFGQAPAHAVIGIPIDVAEYISETKSEKENLAAVTEVLRNRIIALEEICHDR